MLAFPHLSVSQIHKNKNKQTSTLQAVARMGRKALLTVSERVKRLAIEKSVARTHTRSDNLLDSSIYSKACQQLLIVFQRAIVMFFFAKKNCCFVTPSHFTKKLLSRVTCDYLRKTQEKMNEASGKFHSASYSSYLRRREFLFGFNRIAVEFSLLVIRRRGAAATTATTRGGVHRLHIGLGLRRRGSRREAEHGLYQTEYRARSILLSSFLYSLEGRFGIREGLGGRLSMGCTKRKQHNNSSIVFLPFGG